MTDAAAAIAFLFPGQGSQAAGMGADLAGEFPLVRRTFEEADEALGVALSRLCFEGPESELTHTANTQPAILTVSIAVERLLGSYGVRPALAAGHSLGEYSALVSAGVLSFRDAVRAVRLRGEAMQQAVPAGEGAMAAILGLDPEEVVRVCAEASDGEVVSAANFNSPEQTVVAGRPRAVDRVCALAAERGAKRAIPLAVSAPFHCALMRPAEEALARHLAAVEFREPAFPVVANAAADQVRTGAEAREALVRQVCSPVRWTESIAALRRLGATMFVEVGPGRVLTGLLRRIDRSAEGINVEDRPTLDAALRRLGAAGSAPSTGASRRAAGAGGEGRA